MSMLRATSKYEFGENTGVLNVKICTVPVSHKILKQKQETLNNQSTYVTLLINILGKLHGFCCREASKNGGYEKLASYLGHSSPVP